MIKDGIPFPSVVYMLPNVWAKMDLIVWNVALKRNLILYPIPTFINMVVRFSGMTTFQKIVRKINVSMSKM